MERGYPYGNDRDRNWRVDVVMVAVELRGAWCRDLRSDEDSLKRALAWKCPQH